MTVHFIGAGPGAADLITVRGRDLLARCPVCLYAGSLVSKQLLMHCRPDARVIDTAPLTLDQIEAEFVAAHAEGKDVARLHSGDLSVYSALAEQLRRLDRQNIPYTLTPGVPAFAAAAAALGCELTVPELAQSIVLTRISGRASRMPETETLSAFAATRATLAIHLAIGGIERIVAELVPFYGADCPAAVVVRASWPEERVIRGVDDSKQLSADARARLAAKIRARALAIGVGAASVREIDRLNIFHAAVLAMRRALGRLSIRPDHVILDGRAIRSLGTPHTAVVAGDACCYSIACASIIAKVTRDRVMRALAVRYPGYRWERNVGYSTAAHFAGIAERGVTPHHRHSFLPVRQLGLPFDAVGVDDEIALDVTGEAPCLTTDHILADNPPPSSSPLTSEL